MKSRRDFLKTSGCVFSIASIGVPYMQAESREEIKIRFGLCTDSHYADTDARSGRNFRDSLAKLEDCVEFMNKAQVDFLAELGDFKDQDAPPVEEKTLEYLRAAEKVFSGFDGAVYHVIGNHDVDSISKKQFLDIVQNTGIGKDRKYYSFDRKNVHFVVLDANYQSDGTDHERGNFDWRISYMPEEQIEWLKKDLKLTENQAIILIHQPLEGNEAYRVKNAEQVRKVLEDSGRVLAVFQGHDHKGNYVCIDGIHYCTISSMVGGVGKENNAYAVVEVLSDNSIKVTGYGKVVSKILPVQ